MAELKSSLHNQVADILAQRIVGGRFQPGDFMPNIDALRDEFNVSRTVLREAIKLLTAKGLVESRPRVGMSVRPRSDWSLMDSDVLIWRVEAGMDRTFLKDLIDARTIIEPGAAELAARNARKNEIRELRGLFDELSASVGDPEIFIDADIRFHGYILAITHNELVQHMSMILNVAIRVIAMCTITVPGSSKAAMPIHQEVVEAIANRDGAGAFRAMRELVDGASGEIDRFLELTTSETDSRLERASYEVGKILRR